MTTENIAVTQDMRVQMERVYRAWDAAIAAGDISSLVKLYAPDGEIESPLIYEFTRFKTGVFARA